MPIGQVKSRSDGVALSSTPSAVLYFELTIRIKHLIQQNELHTCTSLMQVSNKLCLQSSTYPKCRCLQTLGNQAGLQTFPIHCYGCHDFDHYGPKNAL